MKSTKPPAGPRRAAKPASAPPVEPFWRKGLENLDKSEWESLCDGCGRCCLVKLQDEDTGEIHFTDIACKLFDGDTCRCRDYPDRRKFVRDCVKLTPAKVETIPWLPPTCAYRLVHEGKDLRWWHPLISGSAETVHEAGISVRGRVGATEGQIRLRDYVDRIVAWPGKEPRPAKPK
jgi:uncharacterized cysteine cluster protein YcgN (CxxCxxCC family)